MNDAHGKRTSGTGIKMSYLQKQRCCMLRVDHNNRDIARMRTQSPYTRHGKLKALSEL